MVIDDSLAYALGVAVVGIAGTGVAVGQVLWRTIVTAQRALRADLTAAIARIQHLEEQRTKASERYAEALRLHAQELTRIQTQTNEALRRVARAQEQRNPDEETHPFTRRPGRDGNDA